MSQPGERQGGDGATETRAPEHVAVEAASSSAEVCAAAGLEALRNGDRAAARAWAMRCEAAAGSARDALGAALRGAIAFEDGDLDGALVHFRRAAESPPSDPALARQLGDILSARGAWAEARTLLEAALPGLPGDTTLLIDLGFLRLMSGDRSGARQALEQAVSLQPGDWSIRRSLALIYEAAGEPALAAEALATVPPAAATPRLLGHLAQLQLRLERYEEAEAVFLSLAALDPEHEIVILHGRTWCRIKKRDWRGALEVALAATRLDRLDLTTAFLAHARDGLFGRASCTEQEEAELAERFFMELQEHDEVHGDEPEIIPSTGSEREVEG